MKHQDARNTMGAGQAMNANWRHLPWIIAMLQAAVLQESFVKVIYVSFHGQEPPWNEKLSSTNDPEILEKCKF